MSLLCKINMGDFSFLLNSSILNSVIFDQPSSGGKQEALLTLSLNLWLVLAVIITPPLIIVITLCPHSLQTVALMYFV